MCRSRSVGVGTVVVDVEPARVQSDTHAGIDFDIQRNTRVGPGGRFTSNRLSNDHKQPAFNVIV